MSLSARSPRLIVAAIVLLLAAVVVGSPVDAADVEVPQWNKTVVNGTVAAPDTPNPFVAQLPFNDADFLAWNAYAVHASAERRAAGQGRPPVGPRSDAVNERPGQNGRPNQAQRVFLDTDNANGSAGIDVTGFGPDGSDGVTIDFGPVVELNGSITDAAILNLSSGDEAVGTGVIGDEPDPNIYDFDFFALPDLEAGQAVSIDVNTPLPFEDLDPFVGFWDADGNLLDLNDDGEAGSFDSFLIADVPADGTYYVSIGGFGAFIPADPFDSSSDSITDEIGSQGEYDFAIGVVEFDVDYYKFSLDQGDVFGATVFDGSSMELRAPDGTLLIGSAQDVTFIHPPSSPLPGGGNASLSYVTDQAGTYTLAVRTKSDYLAELRAFRPYGDVPGRGSQILFLDFDGGSVDIGAFGFPPGTIADLSPLVDFLPNWGLDASDEDAVIDAIVASVVESVQEDAAIAGNSEFDIVILNSRDHAEPDSPLASRIIVGGTIPELQIGTVGIAQSIDVGNFETEEVAVVLLDLLSAPVGSPDFIPALSINSYELDPSASIIDAIGIGVGNVTSHEAGHFFANWHTDQFNDSPNIQDQGGNFPNTFGVGPDMIFGSADDVDVDFGPDVFVPAEGFRGVENTLTSISFGLWSNEG